jgi:lipopolysaccharide/colanic/teichoic acid biosynthesis glycosyltransferase
MFDGFEVAGLSPAVLAEPDDVQGLRLKRGFDVVVAGLLLLPLGLIALVLVVINPAFNKGPLIFRQERMGQGCRPFLAVKFRTMSGENGVVRGPYDAVEANRVSALGHVLRRLRIDELPQIVNVLRGEMSMIGPRPDAFAHACAYLRDVPGYADRYALRPGISGFAQTEVGYVETRADMWRKVAADLYYLRHRSFLLDMWIVWRTLVVVLRREGH